MNKAQERLIEAAHSDRDLERIIRYWPYLPWERKYYFIAMLYYYVCIWQPINQAVKAIGKLFG